mmetsp:Transcript_18921/g.40680  ORF Transcript_18921/g.40680 Transcript_18921/m.40680 type:complete len:104 (+) Transcript_18921:1143-1454(+)
MGLHNHLQTKKASATTAKATAATTAEATPAATTTAAILKQKRKSSKSWLQHQWEANPRAKEELRAMQKEKKRRKEEEEDKYKKEEEDEEEEEDSLGWLLPQMK